MEGVRLSDPFCGSSDLRNKIDDGVINRISSIAIQRLPSIPLFDRPINAQRGSAENCKMPSFLC
ncbi:MAG: hypothetical protein HY860_01155 [Chlamydiales bacterium]|nr:hypothetical protein [Chlamydiales bacterium]